MTDPPPHARAAASSPARVCKTAGCGLPARDAHGLCEPCTDVYAATFALYDKLVERDGARLEAETPGFIDAMCRWLATPARATAGALRPAVPPAPVLRQCLQDDAVLIDWQVDRLENFVDELRAMALDSGVPR